MPSRSRTWQRTRIERGIYQQPNGTYAVCVMIDGKPRLRTVAAATLAGARRERELLRAAARLGELPACPQLTFGEIAARPAPSPDAGLAGVRFHTLGHTFASHLIIDVRLDVAQVSPLLGHARTSITLDTYTHLFEQAAHGADIRAQLARSDFARLLAPELEPQLHAREHALSTRARRPPLPRPARRRSRSCPPTRIVRPPRLRGWD